MPDELPDISQPPAPGESSPDAPDAPDAPEASPRPPRESFRQILRRKRRKFLGRIVSNLVGENPPPRPHDDDPDERGPNGIKGHIEESGLWGGIASRIKQTADEYLHEKLDEIESRIDHKLEEIDNRLSEWRDKEIANRLRIIKITLWASVIVAIISLIYAWLKVYFLTPGS
jgi:hypothetical protein